MEFEHKTPGPSFPTWSSRTASSASTRIPEESQPGWWWAAFPGSKGRPFLKSRTISRINLDYLRGVLTARAKGAAAMHAFLLVPPTREDTDFGVIIACALGYLGMCGHGLIGTVYSVIECGIVPKVEPETRVRVDTPSGIIEARAKVTNGKVEGVTFRNQPSFTHTLDYPLTVPGVWGNSVSVAYGGNWYAVVNVEQLGIEINQKNLAQFGKLNNAILDAVNASIQAEHPLLGPAGEVPQAIFYGPPKNPMANSMNLVTSQALGYDRSPCGTGSSAKMAVLHARGELVLNRNMCTKAAPPGPFSPPAWWIR